MNYKKQHFITYGDDRPHAVDRIVKQAHSFKTFSTINSFNHKNIYDKEFYEKNKYVIHQRRGGGYWIWKYYLINQIINKIEDGEFIIYCDAGCELNNKGLKRYYEYLDILNASDKGIISFPLNGNKPSSCDCTEKKWSVKQLFTYLNIDMNSSFAETSQYVGGILILKKCENTMKILDEYKKLLDYDQKLITDYYNKINQEPFFNENRHDQSIWSLLRKKYGSCVIDNDETFFFYQNEDGINMNEYEKNNSKLKWEYPIWASRKKT